MNVTMQPHAHAVGDLDATAARLPYPALAQAVAQVLVDPTVHVPPRLVQALPGGGSLFVMPAQDSRVAMTKLITFTPGNAARGLPTIQGDVLVFDVTTGQRLAMLDGPTVTARRTAAVTLLAAQRLAPQPNGRLLVVGAGVQGRAHMEAFAAGLGTREVWVHSRSAASAQALVAHAQGLGLEARVVAHPNEALPHSAGGHMHACNRCGAGRKPGAKPLCGSGGRVHAGHGGAGSVPLPSRGSNRVGGGGHGFGPP